ncbi:MAG: class I SAM-dependent methyltransferase [Clostridia bacterium]|nr:class I SAM-dependent methyltransferase [Clostridia bacterium]
MKKDELEFYENVGDWDFSMIKCEEEILTEWDFYKKIEENTNEKSLCLDLGCGGGEKVLKNYPKVGMVIATDFSPEMVKTANENLKSYPEKRAKFLEMDNLKMTFPNGMFDLVSARHTIIDCYQIRECLKDGGVLVVRGVDKDDCLELKKIFGRGQGMYDKIAISDLDYANMREAGYSEIEKVEILVNEYYQTEADLMALLLKTPILEKQKENGEMEMPPIEKELFDEYVKKFKTKKGILLKRKYYGIIAKK